jgi:hypothetical protein
LSWIFLHPVPNTPDGTDVFSAAAQLGSQGADVDIHCPGLAQKIGAPDLGQQLFPGIYPARMGHKQIQQIIFLAGQADAAAFCGYGMGCGRKLQTPETQIHIAMRSPYGRYLKKQGGANRVRTLKELARGLETTPELLALIQRMRESAKEHLASEASLTLSTIHSAKGLEWDDVAVISMNKGSFPKPEPETQSAMRQISAREERNLMYVAMTRARHRLLLSSSTSDVSEFMDEVRSDARRLGLT